MAVKVMFEGREVSYPALGRLAGTSTARIRKRMHLGMTAEQAVSLGSASMSAKTLASSFVREELDRLKEAFAQYLATLPAQTEATAIAETHQRRSVTRQAPGWVAPPPGAHVSTDDIRELVARTGLSYSAVYQRIRTYGWTAEQVLRHPKLRYRGPRD